MVATCGDWSLCEGDVQRHHLESWEMARQYPNALCQAEQRESDWEQHG